MQRRVSLLVTSYRRQPPGVNEVLHFEHMGIHRRRAVRCKSAAQQNFEYLTCMRDTRHQLTFLNTQTHKYDILPVPANVTPILGALCTLSLTGGFLPAAARATLQPRGRGLPAGPPPAKGRESAAQMCRVAHLLPNLKLRLVVSLSSDLGHQRNLEFDVNIFLSRSRWATL